MADLLARYLSEELTERSLGRIEATVLEARINSEITIREFGGNRFELTLDFEKGTVLIDDVLGDAASSETLPLEEFLTRIGASQDVLDQEGPIPLSH